MMTARRARAPAPSAPPLRLSMSDLLTVAQAPCQLQQLYDGARMNVGAYYYHHGELVSVADAAAAATGSLVPVNPCAPVDNTSLLGINTVMISLAFIISGAAIVCAANKLYEYVFLYSSPILEEYRERRAVYEERAETRRRAAAEEDAAYRRRVEEVYSSIASTSYDPAHHHGSDSSSSGSSSPEIQALAASSSSSSSCSFGSPSHAIDHPAAGHAGRQLLFAALPGSEHHSSRWQR